jgi:hypothetical protein
MQGPAGHFSTFAMPGVCDALQSGAIRTKRLAENRNGQMAPYGVQMKGYKDQNVNDRLEKAAKARQALLEQFRKRPSEDDPAVIARRAERAAIAEAREAREAERRIQKEKEAAERAVREAAEAAERAARENREAIERVIREEAEKADRKAQRDARYAARKARKKG